MGRVAVPLLEEPIEPGLGLWHRGRNRKPRATEPRSADRYQQRFDRLASALQVSNAPLDEFLARELRVLSLVADPVTTVPG
jgi:hypothetical protein